MTTDEVMDQSAEEGDSVMIAGEDIPGIEPVAVSFEFSGGNLGPSAVWSCEVCAALVAEPMREVHVAWHSQIGA